MYYRTKEGRFKKSMHNGKRQAPGKGPDARGSDPGAAETGSYDAEMVEHVRMVTSLFEGRPVSRREVLEMLEREAKRQQGIGGAEKTTYRARDRTEDSS
jgi:hypothetical protein